MSVGVTLAPHRLSWSHFQELKAAPASGLFAQTRVSMEPFIVEVGRAEGSVRIAKLITRVSLDRANCWVVRGKQTPELLEHERLHYRIAIAVAQELDTALLALRAADIGALKLAANKVMQRIARRVQTISNTYDKQSDHGRIGEKQRVWERRVDTWDLQHKVDF